MIDKLAEALYVGACRWNLRNLPETFDRTAELAKAWQAMPERRKNAYRAQVQAVLTALKYEDGTDESRLIEISNKYRVEAVSLSEAWDGLIDAILTEEPTV